MAFRKTRSPLRLDDRGNVAMITALAMVPLTMASLGAVDLTRSVAGRVQLQDALDAAALAAGRSSTQNSDELQRIGQRILSQNLAGAGDFTLIASSFKVGDGGKVVASARGRFSPLLGSLSGGGEFSASTEVQRANNILEIAMVLDNTGSMAESLGSSQGSKLSHLKTAASNFVEVMRGAARQSTEPNPIRISIVPFSNVVNVGTGNRNANWIDQNAASPINDEIFTKKQDGTTTHHANRFALLTQLKTSWSGCVESRQAPYDIQDTAPSTSSPATLFTPYFAPDENDLFDKHGRRLTNNYLKDPLEDSNGAALDDWGKQGDVRKYANTPEVTLNHNYGPNVGCGLQPIRALSSDFDSLKTAINNMIAVGNTNIPLGLIWGWHTLSPNAPLADGVAYLKPKHKKIVVLMTDGENTMNHPTNTINRSNYSSIGYIWQGRILKANGSPLNSRYASDSDRTAALDDRLKKLCTNMKAANVGIEIYAIGVGVTASSKTLLQNCASGADHYFNVTAGSDMNAAFQSIANQIAQLHLSK